MILHYDRWIKSNSNQNKFEDKCPTCKGPLKQEYVHKTLQLVDCDPDQLKIASEAWIEMGGDPNALPCMLHKRFGIRCDKDGNIIELDYKTRALNGNLSSKLGELHQLKRL